MDPTDLVERWDAWKGAVDCGHTGRVWSAEELRVLSNNARDVLARHVGEGDNVALMLTNTAAFPILLMALLQLKCNPVLVYAASPAAALDRVVDEFGVRYAVHDFIDGVSRLMEQEIPQTDAITIGDLEISLLSLDEQDSGAGAASPGQGVILHPTSGTYGAARYCIRNQRVAVAEAENYIHSISCYGKSRVVATTPLSHAFAYGFCLVASILTDSVLVLDSVFNPRKLLRRERNDPSEIMAVVPPMVRLMTRLASDDPSLRIPQTVFYAGAPCDSVSSEAFATVYGVRLFAIYGTTETGGIATSYSDNGAVAGVGRTLKDVAVDIRDQGQFYELGAGVGEIHVKSTSMMQGYMGAGANGEEIEYWATGDVGFVNGDGALTIVGRVKDIINVGGMKVDPAEVETVLRTHPHVADVAVYPGVREDGEEFVQAAVQTAGEECESDTLREHCLTLLDAYKVPSRIHFVTTIPRSPSGKCLKIQCPGYPKQFIVH